MNKYHKLLALAVMVLAAFSVIVIIDSSEESDAVTYSAKTLYNSSTSSYYFDSGTTITINNVDTDPNEPSYIVRESNSFTLTSTTVRHIDEYDTESVVIGTKTITFYVNAPSTYTCYLYYNANGGSGAPSTQSYTGSSTSNHTFTISNTTPYRSNYTFLGWSTSSSASTASYQPGGTISVSYNGSQTLYAVWQYNAPTPTYYTCYLYYNANGGTDAPSSQSYTGTSTSSHSFTVSYSTPVWTGHTFLGWSTSSSASTASYHGGDSISVSYNGSQTLYAVWSVDTYTVSFSAGTGGSVSQNSISNVPYGASISVSGNTVTINGTTVTAVASSHYSFSSWSNTSGSVTANRTITASFAIDTYTVSFSAGTGGSVSANSINNVPYGSSITVNSNTVTINGTTVTATATSGYSFSSWSNTSGSVTANRTITANFTIDAWTVNVYFNSSVATVKVNNTVVSPNHSFTATSGTSITIEATMNAGYSFTDWLIYEPDTGLYERKYTTTITDTINANTDYTLENTANTYTVTVSAGTGGSVSSNTISNIPYNSPISVSGNTITINGTTVTATANAGYSFGSWSNVSGTITDNRTITASFTANTYTVIFSAGTGGSVSQNSISSIPYDAAITVNGNTVTINGTTVTATADTGYTFTSWTNVSDTITADRTITANFTINTYTVSFSAGPNGSISSNSISNVPYGSAITVSSNTVTINGTTVTATANAGYSFGSWSNASGTITDNRTITANFTANTYTVHVYFDTLAATVKVNNTTVSPSHTFTVATGTSITIEATMNTGYTFTDWLAYEPDTGVYEYIVSTSFTDTIYVDTDYTLEDVANTYTVTFANGIGGTLSSSTITNIPHGSAITVSSNTVTINGSTIVATANPGYSFNSWSNTSGAITADRTITANFSADTWTVNVYFNSMAASVTVNGSTISSGHSFSVYSGESVSLVASMNQGYTFTDWLAYEPDTGAYEHLYTASITDTIYADTDYTLENTANTYTVSFSAGTGGTLSTNTISNVPYGASITVLDNTVRINGTTVTATANIGYAFDSWSNASGTITADRTISASFTPGVYTYNVYYNPYATIEVNGNAILSDYTTTIQYGGSITISATMNTGYNFTDWLIYEPDTGLYERRNTTTITDTIHADTDYTLETSANTYTVSFSAGTGGAVNPTVLTNIPHNSAITVTDNTVTINGRTVTATANPGYTFNEWTNATDPITSARTITATFTPDSWTVNVYFNSAAATVTVDGVSVSPNHSFTASTGASITIEATMNTGYIFTDWLIYEPDTGLYERRNTATITDIISADTDYTLENTANTYTVSFSAGTGGTVSSGSISNIPHGSVVTVVNNTVTINNRTVTATANTGYSFGSWTNATEPITSDRTITANFTAANWTVNVYFNDLAAIVKVNNVVVSPNYTITVPTGTEVKVSAAMKDGYNFSDWLVYEPDTGGYARPTLNPLTETIYVDTDFTLEYTASPLAGEGVWWDNGYFNGSVEIAFNYSNTSTLTHTLTIPLVTYDGIVGDEDNVDEFSANGYVLTITNSYNANISCTLKKPNNQVVTYTPYNNGNWNQYVLKIDVQKGLVSFIGIDAKKGEGFTFLNYDEIFEKVIFDISDNVKNMAIKRIYHDDSGNGDHPHFQVQATTTYLKTYGFVMVNPSLNIYDRFPDYDNLRLNLYSFAYHGDSITINHHTFDMDGSIISGFWYLPKDSPIYENGQIVGYTSENVISEQGVVGSIELKPTLNNVYITWTNINTGGAEDRVCYLTFVNDNMTINMGNFETGDLTISFGGVWYFTTAIYEPYIGYETAYTMDWNSPFNLDKDAFILVFIGIAILCFLVMNLFYRPGILDYLIVGLTGLIAYILL